jgi:hypothetical protein
MLFNMQIMCFWLRQKRCYRAWLIGRYYGMEVNVGKTQVMRISRQPYPGQIIIHQKQLENVEYLKYFGCVITSDARCTRRIKSSIAMAKLPFNKKKNLFNRKLDKHLRKKLVNCCIWRS